LKSIHILLKCHAESLKGCGSRSTLLFILLAVSFSLAAQDKKKTDEEDYVSSNQLRYEDWVYKPNIKSVLLHEISWELSPPLVDFDMGQQLELSFDDLDGDNKNYWYTVIHCDALWKPSDLMPQEYLNSYVEEQITNYAYSAGTLQKYTHYKWVFPNSNIKLTKTGNYIVKVYTAEEKDKPVLTRRFMVFSNKVTITGNVHQAAGADDFMNRQEVDFSILYSAYNLTNPFTDLKVVIQQNNRWDNAIYDIKPIFTKPNELTYDYDDGTNCFEGANEYRYVNSKNFKFITQFTDKIYRDSALNWHLDQKPEEVKEFKRYWQYQDNNGRFLIKAEERDNSEVNADYCWVHFFVPYDYPMSEGNFYLMGNLTDNRFTKQNRLDYNYFKKRYEISLYLKQGYYDYQIGFLEDGKTAANMNFIEGNHWESENDYTVYVYHRQQGTYYDQLICVRKLNSVRK
jgi:hypothetical protein